MTIIKRIINCSIQPYIPDVPKGLSIKEEDQLPNRIIVKNFEFKPENIYLYLSDKQKQGVKTNDLKEELKDQKVLSANVLDHLLEHQELIPREWRWNFIYFWGTIYSASHDSQCVRNLYCDGSKFISSFSWLDHNTWYDDHFAICAN